MSSKCMLFVKSNFEILCALAAYLTYVQKRKEGKPLLLRQTINGHVTHYHKLMSRVLRCQHFISNEQMTILVVFPHINIQ